MTEQEKFRAQLVQRETGRGLPHACIITGPLELARTAAAAMVCTAPLGERPCGRCVPCRKAEQEIHPDIMTLSGPKEGKPITVDQIRALRADAYIRPNEGERKVYLLREADEMNPSAQNAMLKLLEEGPSYAAFLLLAEVLLSGTEEDLFQASMELDRVKKEELIPLLEELEGELGSRLSQSPSRRLVKGLELVRELRQAARLNVHQGQLAGWLCAGMFV